MSDGKKKKMPGRRFEYMIQDEITEYFSRDIEFDWPEPYEPPYPLTEAERKLLRLNSTVRSPEEWLKEELSLTDKRMWSKPDTTT